MNKPMKLKGFIELKDDRTLFFHGNIIDGSSFTIQVDQFDVELNQDFRPSKRRVEGWLFVQQEAQQSNRVYLTLPKPSIQHGRQIVVDELQLMPRFATLADFGAKSKPVGKKIPAAKDDDSNRDLLKD